jgi:hypothetical protein
MLLPVFRLGWTRGIPVVTLLTAASLIHPFAHAQGAPGRTERADPLDAQARVPAITHVSPLASYRRLGDDKRIAWAEANETVNRIGGWRAYAREAQQPDPAAPAPTPTPTLTPTPTPSAAPNAAPSSAPSAAPRHGGHKMH